MPGTKRRGENEERASEPLRGNQLWPPFDREDGRRRFFPKPVPREVGPIEGLPDDRHDTVSCPSPRSPARNSAKAESFGDANVADQLPEQRGVTQRDHL